MVKKNYKHIIRVCVLLIAVWWQTSGAAAQGVSQQQAMQAAQAFMQQYGRQIQSEAQPVKRRVARKDGSEPLYVFNTTDGAGFVIVSGNEHTEAILGYSLEGAYDADHVHPAFEGWMLTMEQQLATLTEAPARVPIHKAIAPLIKTQWDQGAATTTGLYYNTTCPAIGSKRCITGCVATAMAQLMYYYQWPKAATKSVPSYTANATVGTLAALPATTFDWDNMTEHYNSSSTSAQIAAVSKLMRYCGQAAQMDYGLTGSGAVFSTGTKGMVEYFDYDPYTYRSLMRIDYSATEWDQLIYDELAAKRPVFYDGQSSTGGHAFLCDGCDNQGNYHINWGWGGSYDGYYKLFLANPYQDERSGYYESQGAFIGIQPNTGVIPADDDDDPDPVPDGIVAHAGLESVADTKITLTMGTGYGNGAQAFGYGLGILADDGEITPVFDRSAYYEDQTLDEGWYYTLDFDLQFADLPEGRYTLIPISKQKGNVWKRCTPLTMWFDVTVASDDISIVSHPIEQLSLSNVKVQEFSYGTGSQVTATVTNGGDKFDDWVEVYTVWGSRKNYQFGEKIKIKPGESRVLNFSLLLSAEEENTLLFCTGDVNNSFGTAVVNPSVKLDGNAIAFEGNNVATMLQPVTVTVANEGGVDYRGALYLFLQNGSTTTLLTQRGLEVEAGGKVDIPAYFTVDTPGEYTLLVATDDLVSHIIGQTPLSIRAVPTTESKLALENLIVEPAVESLCTVTVNNAGTDTFCDRVILRLFRYNDGSYKWLGDTPSAYLNLPVGESTTFALSFTDLEPGGSYYLECLYNSFMGNSESSKYIYHGYFDVPELPVGIEEVQSTKYEVQPTDGNIYDLTGRRVQNPTRGGMYIVNGKKVLVK
jgi:hypothetical protein